MAGELLPKADLNSLATRAPSSADQPTEQDLEAAIAEITGGNLMYSTRGLLGLPLRTWPIRIPEEMNYSAVNCGVSLRVNSFRTIHPRSRTARYSGSKIK